MSSGLELRVGNKYRLGRKIGSGSFGDIYLGENATRLLANARNFGNLSLLQAHGCIVPIA